MSFALKNYCLNTAEGNLRRWFPKSILDLSGTDETKVNKYDLEEFCLELYILALNDFGAERCDVDSYNQLDQEVMNHIFHNASTVRYRTIGTTSNFAVRRAGFTDVPKESNVNIVGFELDWTPAKSGQVIHELYSAVERLSTKFRETAYALLSDVSNGGSFSARNDGYSLGPIRAIWGGDLSASDVKLIIEETINKIRIQVLVN